MEKRSYLYTTWFLEQNESMKRGRSQVTAPTKIQRKRNLLRLEPSCPDLLPQCQARAMKAARAQDREVLTGADRANILATLVRLALVARPTGKAMGNAR